MYTPSAQPKIANWNGVGAVSIRRALRTGACAAAFGLVGACATLDPGAGDTLDAAPPLDPRTEISGGPLDAARAAYDVQRYTLAIAVDPDARSLNGAVTIDAKIVSATDEIVLDLDPRFEIYGASVDGEDADVMRDGPQLKVALGQAATPGATHSIIVSYAGKPHVAERAPWDGGWVWDETADGRTWAGVAVQGNGCDFWFPCKDHVSDEPDQGVVLKITVPEGLAVASNGVLKEVITSDTGDQTYHWATNQPVNPYNINITVAPFERLQDTYDGVLGVTIPIEYWALPENVDKARALIESDLKPHLAWFEATVGPYPWGDEKVGIVDTPYLGMEHQTINAYGNAYLGGPHGFDWLMHHELAHEWFGNVMSHTGEEGIWLHEGFGAYMQPLYARDVLGDVAHHHGLYAARLGVTNCAAIDPGVPLFSDVSYHSDVYSKASLVLRTLHVYLGEQGFWEATRELVYDTTDMASLSYPMTPIQRSTADFEAIVSKVAGKDMSWFFDVYVRHTELPKLLVERDGDILRLEWESRAGAAFELPVPVEIGGAEILAPMEGGRAEVRAPEGRKVRIDPKMTVLRHLDIARRGGNAPCPQDEDA